MAAAGTGSEGPPGERRAPGAGLERLASLGFTYFAIAAFMVLYLVSIDWVERLLHESFRAGVERATRVNPVDGPIVTQIQNRVSELVSDSPWVRYGGVRVNATVLGADGQTPLYVGGGKVLPPPPERSLDGVMREWIDLLPAIADVYVSVPHGSALSAGIFVGYGAILVQSLVSYTRRIARQAEAQLAAIVAARDSSADRARSIEEELGKVRDRLREIEPAERAQAAEIDALEQERVDLHAKLRELAEREGQLRARASRAGELEDERQALEELLDEALHDVSSKDAEITALQDRLKNEDKRQTAQSKGRSREAERLAKRFGALYRNLEVDDRAIADLVALGDESQKLRAEEVLKRLDDDPDTAAVRRKVGGLPPHLSIFELGFAGKGRIYYMRSERGGYRVLAIGGKATQKQDLEYLSRVG
jgi:predicted  nucleic acid-binding Zn-ribbon protein